MSHDSGNAQPGHAEVGRARPGHAESGHAQPGHAESGHAQPGQAQSGQAEPAATPVPASLQLAWGQRPRTSRRGRSGLTLARIVEAGIAVARTDGLAGLSMSRVAAELGVAAMSLYHHVAAKDELLALMVDAALGTPPAVPLRETRWRAGLDRWARAQYAAYRANPWVLQVPVTAPPLGPNHVAWLEAALRCLAGTELTEQRKLSTVLLLNGFVRSQASMITDLSPPSADATAGAGYGVLLARLTDPMHFPALHQAIASGALDDDEGIWGEFDFGLDLILDGVETLVASAAAAARDRRVPDEGSTGHTIA